jgi:HK97 gp10 family phage protein
MSKWACVERPRVPKVTGRDKAQGRLDGIAGEQAIKRVGQALYWGAQQIQAEAQHLITEGSVSGKNHVPSLPGEPPNNDTGVLKSHIEAVQTAPLRAEASSNAPYAVPLEAGTSKMAARPYMGPATRNKRAEIVAKVVEAVNISIRS